MGAGRGMLAQATAVLSACRPRRRGSWSILFAASAGNQAITTLRSTNKTVAREIEKVLQSAVANATQKIYDIDVDRLFVAACFVNEGPR